MESDDPETDKKTNICPICERDFGTIAGIRQHWTKSHTDEEIQAAIASKIPPTQHSQPSYGGTIWSKFQLIKCNAGSSSDLTYQQFNIIETNATGDCLFSSVMNFLRGRRNDFSDVPDSLTELRTKVVNHILAVHNDGSGSNLVTLLSICKNKFLSWQPMTIT